MCRRRIPSQPVPEPSRPSSGPLNRPFRSRLSPQHFFATDVSVMAALLAGFARSNGGDASNLAGTGLAVLAVNSTAFFPAGLRDPEEAEGTGCGERGAGDRDRTLSCACPTQKSKNFVSKARTTPLRSVVLSACRGGPSLSVGLRRCTGYFGG